ncbi:MAG: replicative DNA helicase [Kiritimatiellae bacterium]|nr:replicative DNA helicase [Kiritimatiellia bacterium]MDD5522140.1 replicative DNA helicase [Kiritimatiellia bacterium]
MAMESVSSQPVTRTGRVPPHSEEAERGVLGSILLDSARVVDICVERQIVPESFYVPVHRIVYEAMLDLAKQAAAIDILTVTERLKAVGGLEAIGGTVFLDRLIDSTPTAAHAEYYAEIVRQKYLLRSIISCAREAENTCYEADDSADHTLGKVEQAFLDITERQHGYVMQWPTAIKQTMEHIENILIARKGLSGVSTGFANLDKKLQGLRSSEMIILAARPSMGKTSLAMNIAANVALGKGSDHAAKAVGIFSLEMSHEALVMRMLCSYAEVSAFKLAGGYVASSAHGKLTQAASILTKAPIYLDDTGGLDILELRARARRMKKKQNIELIVIDYLQLLHSSEYARQGKQVETAHISGNLKAMAKELKLPVLVLSQLSRAPEQRDKLGKPKLSDLRDSGAIEQDADVVCMLRRPCKYPEDEEQNDLTLAVVDVAKHRNGPTGEVRLNFDEEFTRFRDREHGVDEDLDTAAGAPDADAEVEVQ